MARWTNKAPEVRHILRIFEDAQECSGKEGVVVLTSGEQVRGRIIPETVSRDPLRRRVAGSLKVASDQGEQEIDYLKVHKVACPVGSG
jgi:hypothetical protein